MLRISNCVAIVAISFATADVGVADVGFRFAPSRSENRLRNLLDGTGPEYLRSDDLTSSWVSASQADNEYVVDAFLARDDHKSVGLSAALGSDGWFIIEFENQFDTDGNVFYDRRFDPYGNSPLGRRHFLSHAHVLKPGRYGLGFQLQDLTCSRDGGNCLSEAAVKLTIRVHEIDEPLVGDANLDGKVAFDDFLTLSKNYDRVEFLTNGWFGGDFGFNGHVGFDDFTLLSSNFGNTKESTIAVVPEPANSLGAGLLILLLAGRPRVVLFALIDRPMHMHSNLAYVSVPSLGVRTRTIK